MKRLLLLCLAILSACSTSERAPRWTLMMHRPDHDPVEVLDLPADTSVPYSHVTELQGVRIEFSLQPHGDYAVFNATASSNKPTQLFLSLTARYTHETPYNFNGPVAGSEIFRQSPHDVNAWIVTTIAEQAVPVVALKTEGGFEVALNGSPYLYDNFTSQAFYHNDKIASLRSGDDGQSPGLKPDTARTLSLDYNAEKTQVFSPGRVLAHYHTVSPSESHRFEGLLFTSNTSSVNGLRKDVNQFAADYFSGGSATDYFGALAFVTPYMNLRTNETGKSDVWVVPSVEYSNIQYGRDAFWMSMMLDPTLAAECLRNELATVNHFAEYPLFAVIWAYRTHKAGMVVDSALVQQYVDAIEARVANAWYYSYLESDGRLDFQYWGDLMALEKDDVVTYNQGLLAVALRAARDMGLVVKTDPQKAAAQYRSLYNSDLGFYPVSKKKLNILSPDPLIGDLLSILYFEQPLLPDKAVRSHFERITKNAATPYGFKIVSNADGTYLRPQQYDIPGYTSQVNREKIPDGRYFRGGSYFLYDNLFLIDAYLHGIEEAEPLLRWRVSLDFAIGNTTYETINTKTGEPWKPNMGWNVAVYAIWKKLVDDGRASGSLFKEIDAVAANQAKSPQ